jgi:hypothetical protein
MNKSMPDGMRYAQTPGTDPSQMQQPYSQEHFPQQHAGENQQAFASESQS